MRIVGGERTHPELERTGLDKVVYVLDQLAKGTAALAVWPHKT